MPGVLKAMPVDQWDLPGLLYLVGAMNDKVSIDSVADQMLVVLFHLYPKWVELRPVYWDTWKQKHLNYEKAKVTRSELSW